MLRPVSLAFGVPAMRFGEQGIHIEVTDLAALDLIKGDLEFTANIFVVQTKIIVLGEQNVLVLSLLVLDWNRTSWPSRGGFWRSAVSVCPEVRRRLRTS